MNYELIVGVCVLLLVAGSLFYLSVKQFGFSLASEMFLIIFGVFGGTFLGIVLVVYGLAK